MNSQSSLPISDINTTSWPRRAIKACASCRRDKIRCDGLRPCGGCSKKGYTANQCVDGCEPCRRARVRCEDGKPCQRCREMRIECVEETMAPISRQDPPPTSQARPARANAAERAKLACTNCRRDNKKCDDQRPCSRCIARSEECIHVGRGPKLVKLRCEGCRQENKRCEDARPCRYCLESGKQCITTPRKGRGHGTRVKAACTNCRRDKIRCDGVRPCAACTRKGYDCIERVCGICSREGKTSDCTHRRVHEQEPIPCGSQTDENHHPQVFSSTAHIEQPQLPESPTEMSQHPPIQQMALLPHTQSMYQTMSPVPHFYYPQQPMGGSGPSSINQPMYMTDQHRNNAYYSAIDPNIDNRHASTSGYLPDPR
ncbi:hypothetical protein BD779DRAFT_1511725 [Infundibulicybe gibba]|nr:hypothetical protein BD779DRAFT_1511725 [Infundibulicybe gibba]